MTDNRGVVQGGKGTGLQFIRSDDSLFIGNFLCSKIKKNRKQIDYLEFFFGPILSVPFFGIFQLPPHLLEGLWAAVG